MIENTGAVTGTISPDPDFATMIGGSTFTMAKMPVGDITVYDGKEQYKLKPIQDVTPYEAVKLMQMLVMAVIPSNYYYDYLGYINQNNLQRHFEKLS